MKKRLQVILIGSFLVPSSTGVLLASDARCHAWIAQATAVAAQNVVEKKRHYSKKVLAAWAVWRMQHPNAKPVVKAVVLRPHMPMAAVGPDELWFRCDATVTTSDEAVAIVTEIETPAGPVPPTNLFADSTDAPGPFTLVADATPTPDTGSPAFGPPVSFIAPILGGPGGSGSTPVSRVPPPDSPPPASPPSDNPPTTGSTVPPPTSPTLPVPPTTPTPPVAVAAEPSSLVLLGTGVAVTAGAFRRRRRSS